MCNSRAPGSPEGNSLVHLGELFSSVRINDIPLIIGWNSFDGSSLRYATEKVLADTPDEVIAAYAEEGLQGRDLAYSIYTDRHNGAPARWIAAQTSTGAPTYLYQFSYVYGGRDSALNDAHQTEYFVYL